MFMQSVGIVAEYNPFHNGHLYHLQKVKEMFPETVIILVLGGSFTQRGNVSILDKWTKTKIALEAGADMVVELPFPFATGSADIFAEGAMAILNYLQAEAVVFGSESNDIEGMEKLVDIQLQDPTFSSLVQVYLRMGYNYPTALSQALTEITGHTYHLPNDLLGISYIKAIKRHHYSIRPYSIKRTTNYHEQDSTQTITSATTIRNRLQQKKAIEEQVPAFVYPYLPKKIVTIDDYFCYCKYKILCDHQLDQYALVDKGMAQKLKQHINQCQNFDQLIHCVKSRNLTYNRIARMLLYILCGYTKNMAENAKMITYIRLLGFSKNGQQYLNKIKKEIEVPIISKFKRDKDPMLAFEQQVTNIYALAFPTDQQLQLIKQETQTSPIKKEDLYEINA